MKKSNRNKKNVSMHDIARLAGVSIATVSRALHHPELVTDQTKEKIVQAANQLNYMPNRLAQSLRTSRSNIVGLIVPDVINPIYTELVEIIQNQFDDLGYSLILCESGENPKKELDYLRLLQGWNAEAIIIAPVEKPEITSPVWGAVSGKLIQLSRYLPGINSAAILSDNCGGARKATKHLIDLGYKRIAMIGGPSTINTAQDRATGYYQALEEAGIDLCLKYVIHGPFSEEHGYQATKKLLSLGVLPEAIFSCSNLITIGALTALKEAKIKIPRDIAFVSFDDLNTGPILDPPLTCVAQRLRDIAQGAVRFFVDMIQNKVASPKVEIVPTDLIIRESCGYLTRISRKS